MNNAAVEFGNRLKSQRKYKRLSQTDLGKLIGKSQGYISSIESGRHVMTEDLADEFAMALDVSAGYLLEKEGKAPEVSVTKEEEKKPKKSSKRALAPNTLDVQNQVQKNLDYLFKKTGDQYFISPKTSLNTLVEIANHYKLPVSYLFENHESELLKKEIDSKHKELEKLEKKYQELMDKE